MKIIIIIIIVIIVKNSNKTLLIDLKKNRTIYRFKNMKY